MTERQRWRETLLFGSPDRIPLAPGGGRESTRARWHSEGLPEKIDGAEAIVEYAYRQVGGVLPQSESGPGFPVDQCMIPHFEEKVIERKENSQIVQDWKGNICEIGNEYTVEYLRTPIDFVTRRWIKCPVEDMADWEDMKKRYDPDDPARCPENPKETGRLAMEGGRYLELNFSGPFWQLREWVGFENLCMYFYDKPNLLADMLAFWKDFIGRMLENIFQYVTPDCIHLSEDMAYKNFSMISPRMVRDHLLPLYRYWGDIVRGHGCPLYGMDSDGYIGELIPIWIEAGANVCDPIEVAAGNDINQFRREFGRDMAYRGGVDKRKMAAGGKAIEDEMRRIDPVIQDGGYVPSCDHGIPHDVSWPNFLQYMKLLARATGWL